MARARGEGTVYRRKDGYWVARLQVGHDENGKRKHRYRYAKSQAKAIEALAGLRDRASDGVIEADCTVAEFLDFWLEESVATSVRPLTFNSYSMHVRKHLAPALGGIRLKDLGSAARAGDDE